MTIPRTEKLEQTQKSGRFIMRAHQTFRVLLNTPVFKQMKVGDSKGNEPTSKTLSFSVIEKGKPTPYLIRVSELIQNLELDKRILIQSVSLMMLSKVEHFITQFENCNKIYKFVNIKLNYDVNFNINYNLFIKISNNFILNKFIIIVFYYFVLQN